MLGRVRQTVRRALARYPVRAEIEEMVGDYPSPTGSANLWMGRGLEPGLYCAITYRAELQPYVRSTVVQGIDPIR